MSTSGKRAKAVRVFRPEGEVVIALNESRQYAFGRADSADIFLDDARVSRHHGILRFEAGAWAFEDLRSSNGSFICDANELAEHLGLEEHPELSDDDEDDDTILADQTGIVHLDTEQEDEVRDMSVLPVKRIGSREIARLAPGDAVFLGSKRVGFELVNELPDDAVGSLSDVGSSGELAEKVEIAGRTSLPVFLLGPSGSGKTSTAWQIHQRSRPKGAFVVLNCAGLQDDPTWLRSELYGQVKDAFAGAKERPGKFFEADQGTLFLDEVESLPREGQGFLLSLLDTNKAGDFAKLGGSGRSSPRPDVRVVSASKVPLARSGLREDLCWRLGSGHAVVIPPLDDRRQEIPALIRTFVRDRAGMKGEAEPHFSDGAVRYMKEMSWPGHIRQLESAVRSIVDTARAKAAIRGRSGELAIKVDGVKAWEREQLAAFGSPGASVGQAAPRKKARALTREDIVAALDACEWNVVHTAERLGVAVRTVYNKMERFKIER